MIEWEQSSPEVSNETEDKASIVLPARGKSKSGFKQAASILISECRKKNGKTLNCHAMSKRLDMERRRFYDIINVLDAIDYFKKYDADTFIWRGAECCRDKLYRIALSRGVFDSTKNLNTVFPSKKCISITQISIDILLMFSALQKRKLDLKELSYYLSRSNGREKTMICKLYQAAAIFELAGIVEKTCSIGEFEISEKYYLRFEDHPTFINSLMKYKSKKDDFLLKRNEEFISAHLRRKKAMIKNKKSEYYDEI